MPGENRQYINKSMDTVQNTIKSLQETLDSIDDEDNKTTIELAIDYLDSACQELYDFRD